MKKCNIEGCTKPHYGKGWCKMHHQRNWKHGSPHFTKVIRDNDDDRFLSHIEIVTETGCWIWTASISKHGYGKFTYKCNTMPAHRFAWEMAHGTIPDGMQVLHRCDVRSCVNPNHLFIGTHQDNMADMVSKGRKKPTMARLSDGDVRNIKHLLTTKPRRGLSASLAREYGVCRDTIGRIKTGKAWTNLR